jgi:hypothetical protein
LAGSDKRRQWRAQTFSFSPTTDLRFFPTHSVLFFGTWKECRTAFLYRFPLTRYFRVIQPIQSQAKLLASYKWKLSHWW